MYYLIVSMCVLARLRCFAWLVRPIRVCTSVSLVCVCLCCCCCAQLAALQQAWEAHVKDMERERAEIDTEKEILRSVEETIFLRLKQQLELAELEPTLQASPANVS